jgi:hypothetical protein
LPLWFKAVLAVVALACGKSFTRCKNGKKISGKKMRR